MPREHLIGWGKLFHEDGRKPVLVRYHIDRITPLLSAGRLPPAAALAEITGRVAIDPQQALSDFVGTTARLELEGEGTLSIVIQDIDGKIVRAWQN
jgi:hypothetical protein